MITMGTIFKNKSECRNFKQLNLNQIELNPYQPRTHFDQTELVALAASIRKYGIINPLTVRNVDGTYQLISGERRLRAAKMAGLTSVPCNIYGADENVSAELALVENIMRENLNYFEEAAGFMRLNREHNMTQQAIAERIGKTQSYVANKIRLLKIDDETREIIAKYTLSERHSRALLSIPDTDLRALAAKHIGVDGLNVEQSEKYITYLLNNLNCTTKSAKKNNSQFFIKDVRLVLNVIKKSVDTLITSGIKAEYETSESGGFTIISVRIPQKK